MQTSLLFVLLCSASVVIQSLQEVKFMNEIVTFDGEIKYISQDYPDYVGDNNMITYSDDDVPSSFSYWYDNGLMTQVLNQHVSQYCGSCWIHATASTLADRLKIQSNGKQLDIIPSIQMILNCGKMVGSCSGGDVHALLRYWHNSKDGVPDSTCNPYRAADGLCNDLGICYTCSYTGLCYQVFNYVSVKVSDYYRVIGDTNIQKEIKANGPVICYINSDCIETYTGGISPYNETETGGKCNALQFNHAIQINGWGVDESDGTQYWVIRNSWGTSYGENGFLRIVRGGAYKPLGCYAATPYLDYVNADAQQ